MFLLYLVVVGLIVLHYVRKLCERPKNYPPGPKWVPFFGNLLLLKQLSKECRGQHLAMQKLAQQYNTKVLGLKLGRDYVVAVFSYEVVKKTLTEEVYEGRPDNFFMRLRCMGTRRGITGTDGEHWRIQRAFVVTHLRNVGYGKKPMENFIREEIQEVLDILSKTGEAVKVGKILAPAVINILWALTCGSRIERSDNRLDTLLTIMGKRSKAFDMAGGTLNQLPFLRFVAPEQCRDDIYRVPYVEAVLQEAERYCHVAPIYGPRRVLRDTELEGYLIPKNTTVLISSYSVHNDTEYWKDPEVFRPDRFLDNDGKLLNKERFIPFGLGKRRCLGDALAKSCIFVFFVEIMRKYEVGLSPGSKKPLGIPIPGMTLSPEDYRAKFVERQL